MIARVTVLALAAALAGCNKKEDKKGGGSSKDDTATDTATTGTVAVATNLSDLKLSESLSLEVPASVKAQGQEAQVDDTGKLAVGATGLSTLPLRKKSREACDIRNKVHESMEIVKSIATEVCYIEAESAKLQFGQKYKISFTDEGKTYSHAVWVQDKKDAGLLIQLCDDGKLTEQITVVGNKKGGASKGYFKSFDEFDGDTWAAEGFFDSKFSKADRMRIAMKSSGTTKSEDGQAITYRESVAMDLKQDGISLINMAADGKQEPDITWADSGTARIGPRFGSALLHSDGFGSYRAYFDAAGRILKAGATDAFAEGGKYFVKKDELQPPLGESYKPKGFGSDAWDCSGAVEIDPEITEAQANACEALSDVFEYEDCETDDYDYSDPESVQAADLKESFGDFGDFDKTDLEE